MNRRYFIQSLATVVASSLIQPPPVKYFFAPRGGWRIPWTPAMLAQAVLWNARGTSGLPINVRAYEEIVSAIPIEHRRYDMNAGGLRFLGCILFPVVETDVPYNEVGIDDRRIEGCNDYSGELRWIDRRTLSVYQSKLL